MTTTPSTSRRRVLGGAAWAVPAITMASAAPAMAASGTAAMSATDVEVLSTGQRLSFITDVNNVGTGTTADLKATAQVTAPSAASWGPSPTATAADLGTSSNWTLVSVTGTGATRTFLFDAITEFPAQSATRFFDFEINTNGGAIAPGTLVRTFIPGGSGTPAQLTTSYAARSSRSLPTGRG